MRVDPNRELSRAAEVTPARKPESPVSATDSAQVSGSAGLKRALNEIPVVRPEMVAKAKALLEDPSYPGDKTLDQVAGLLADHLESKPSAG